MFGTNVFSSSSGDDEPIDIYILGMGVPVKQPVLRVCGFQGSSMWNTSGSFTEPWLFQHVFSTRCGGWMPLTGEPEVNIELVSQTRLDDDDEEEEEDDDDACL